MNRSDLPFGSEFSPSQIDLAEVLQLADLHGGDWRAFEAAVRSKYFDGYPTTEYNRAKLANNTKLSMIAYGIIDRDAALTELGRQLLVLRVDKDALYKTLARHILLNLHGVTLIQCVQDIAATGGIVTLVTLRKWLAERNVTFPRGGKHPSIMRLWLEKAGVFASGWLVNEPRYEQVLGAAIKEIETLAGFTAEQRAYIKTLGNLGDGVYVARDIEDLAYTTYGVKFNEKSLPKDVLYPLERAGYIDIAKATDGRGAKSGLVQPTAKLLNELVEPILDQFAKQTDASLRPLLRKPLANILNELDSADRHIRGLALEALAFKLMRLIDLEYVATRLRGAATGGAEVDVIFHSSRLVFSRWQVQCKNTARVSLEDVAKEVGLTHMLKSNVIVIVSTGAIGAEARRYANKIMVDSNLCFVMIDRNDIGAIISNPTAIVNVLNREAVRAMKLKVLDI